MIYIIKYTIIIMSENKKDKAIEEKDVKETTSKKTSKKGETKTVKKETKKTTKKKETKPKTKSKQKKENSKKIVRRNSNRRSTIDNMKNLLNGDFQIYYKDKLIATKDTPIYIDEKYIKIQNINYFYNQIKIIKKH